MNLILLGRARNYLWLKTEMRAVLIKDIWLEYLKRNEGDHLHALYDLEFDIAQLEQREEYEICQALYDTIDNYEQLSKLKLR